MLLLIMEYYISPTGLLSSEQPLNLYFHGLHDRI